jgi:hypothetical protein
MFRLNVHLMLTVAEILDVIQHIKSVSEFYWQNVYFHLTYILWRLCVTWDIDSTSTESLLYFIWELKSLHMGLSILCNVHSWVPPHHSSLLIVHTNIPSPLSSAPCDAKFFVKANSYAPWDAFQFELDLTLLWYFIIFSVCIRFEHVSLSHAPSPPFSFSESQFRQCANLTAV